jgi:hypothetical protein
MKHMHIRILVCSFFFIHVSLTNIAAQDAAVQFYPEIKRQVIQSIGGNYCQANYTDHAWDAVGEATLKEFKPSHVRVALPMKLRGKTYDGYKGDKFLKQPIVIKLLEALKRMKDEYAVENFTVSVWNVADELVENPDDRAKRVIKREAYPEVIQMITDFLLQAKNDYGVEVDYFSFNESDGGYMVLFSPKETRVFLQMLSDKFETSGLKTTFLWADTHKTVGTVEFATQIIADTALRDELGPLCFHSWWSENIPNSEFERIAALAEAWNRPVWCSELGFDAMAHRTKGMNATWDYGMRFAKISQRMLKHARVEVSLYWTWQNNYSIMSADTEEKYPSYFVTKHQTDYLNTGTQIVHTKSSDPQLLSLGGIQPDGKRVLHLINLHEHSLIVYLTGVHAQSYSHVATTEKNLWETTENESVLSENQPIELQLKPHSVNTFILK